MDTICAIATPRATSAIGVIRVSGDRAFEICEKFITPKSCRLSDMQSSAMRLCDITDGKYNIDSALVCIFRAPHSYTGENTVEINCHGGIAILDRVMKLLIKHGARSALGGEFTKRAFLNGKMDLLQSEAVIDLINSQTALESSLALSRISGKLSGEFDNIFDLLVELNTDILAYIDFPDEGLADTDTDTVISKLKDILKRLTALEKSFSTGSVIKDGANTVILGAPNVGKSTLLNAILGYDRAIVSSTAGTTRDMVTERAVMGDITLNLCDTAGIRENAEEIERMGIDIAKRELENADLVFALFDASKPLEKDDFEIIRLCENKNAICVINKTDLDEKIDRQGLESSFSYTVDISARENSGLDRLREIVEDMFLSDKVSVESGMLLTNARHFERVVKAREKVENALNTLECGFTPDLASIDITDAASEIGQITGASVSDRIIDDIFSKFCVGK